MKFLLINLPKLKKWEEDEIELLHYVKANPQIKFIIAPHEIDDSNIEKIKSLLFKNNISCHLFSNNETELTHSVLILNTIGILSSVYQYGNVALIGGGFNNGIHNLLEPSVFGLPVMFGPNHYKFNEASELIKLHAGFEFKTSKDLIQYLDKFLNDSEFLDQTSLFAKNYVVKNAGSTDVIYLGLQKDLI